MKGNRRVITYFVEDRAQEFFIRAWAERIAIDVGITVLHNLASVTGGYRALAHLKKFVQDEPEEARATTDLLIISVDGNCRGYQAKRNEIVHIVQRGKYLKPFLCAVPDPHIERWYLCDGEAVRQALSTTIKPIVPAYKCERDRYKAELIKVIEQAGMTPESGGSEHAEAIVKAMDFYRAGKNDPSLKLFLDDLRAALKS